MSFLQFVFLSFVYETYVPFIAWRTLYSCFLPYRSDACQNICWLVSRLIAYAIELVTKFGSL